MKVAVLADIHANLAAFTAVIADIERWQPDAVIIAGDIINRGPLPRPCLELALRMRTERGWYVLRGIMKGTCYTTTTIFRWAARRRVVDVHC